MYGIYHVRLAALPFRLGGFGTYVRERGIQVLPPGNTNRFTVDQGPQLIIPEYLLDTTLTSSASAHVTLDFSRMAGTDSDRVPISRAFIVEKSG